jgi:hypothetical protein
MPAIKSAQEIGLKWSRKAQASSADYDAGVKNPTKDWQTETANAAASYAAGVQASIGRGAFASGVKKAGTAKWSKMVVEKGVPRWAGGISAGQEEYTKNFAAFADVISRTTLPARGARGSAQNYERVRTMGQALHEAKVGGK